MPRTSLLPTLALAALTLASTGCIKKMLVDGQIEGTREGAKQMDTTTDFEVARTAAAAGLAQFEGMHRLAPGNTDAYYLLVKNYTSYAFAFAEDDKELAELRDDDDQAEYHKQRASSLYTRAIGYGTEWIEARHPGFAAALKSGKDTDMAAYLKKFGDPNDSYDDKEEADILFWTGQAWCARVNVTKEIGLIGTLYVGLKMIERVVELFPDYESGTGFMLLGAIKSGTGEAMYGHQMFVDAAAAFDKAEQLSGGHVQLIKVQRALNYACHMDDPAPGRKGSFDLYSKLLNDVLSTDDPSPEHRLINSIAKRRARRYLSEKWVNEYAEECGWDLDAIAKAPAAPPVVPPPAPAPAPAK